VITIASSGPCTLAFLFCIVCRTVSPTILLGRRDEVLINNYSWRMNSEEIAALVEERSLLRKEKKWADADSIMQRLTSPPYNLEVIDHDDGRTTVVERVREKKDTDTIIWTELTIERDRDTPSDGCGGGAIPTFIATCNEAHYRERLLLTQSYLQKRSSTFSPLTSVQLLSLSEEVYSPKRILFEGWRQILIPKLLALECETISSSTIPPLHFIFVLEDDARLFSFADDDSFLPSLRSIIASAFHKYAALDVISLGHAVAANAPIRDSIIDNSTAGINIHATTALALRINSLPKILAALEEVSAAKRTHLDFIFFQSRLHSLGVGVFDPPSFGWAENEVTLTPAASGQRRQGGGRLAAKEPPRAMEMKLFARGVEI